MKKARWWKRQEKAAQAFDADERVELHLFLQRQNIQSYSRHRGEAKAEIICHKWKGSIESIGIDQILKFKGETVNKIV